MDFEIQWHIKEYHPNNYHHECEFLQKNTTNIKRNYQKEEMEDIQGEANFRRQEIRKQGRAD